VAKLPQGIKRLSRVSNLYTIGVANNNAEKNSTARQSLEIPKQQDSLKKQNTLV